MNLTERRLRRSESLDFEAIAVWLDKHHGPSDAAFLLSFLQGTCDHPYHVANLTDYVPDYVCDLCGG